MNQGPCGELISRMAGAVGAITTAHPLRVALTGSSARIWSRPCAASC
ncbi:hypothetical protein [[Actinomadura] parvosata]